MVHIIFFRKSKTYFTFNNFSSEDRAVYEIMWGKCDTARQVTDGNTTRSTHFACWITKATYPNSEFVIHIAFPRQQWLLEGASLLHYTHTLCLILHNVTKEGSSESTYDMNSAKTLSILTSRMHINLLSSVLWIQTCTITITST
jgi:hypothetical protein